MNGRKPGASVALLTAFWLTGCTDPLLGTWESSDPETTGDPLMGAWITRLGPADSDTVDDTLQVAFDYDGTWQFVDTQVFAASDPLLPGCTQTTRWSGTFTRPEALTLVLASTEPGARTRTGCLDPANDATSTEGAIDGTIVYRTVDSGFSAVFFGLTLMPQPPLPLTEIELSRDGMFDYMWELTFDADGTWLFESHGTYFPESLLYPSCLETVAMSGTYVESAGTVEEGWDLLTIEAAADAELTRSGCADPAQDGSSTRPIADAMGALDGPHDYRVWAGDELQIGFDHEDASYRTSFYRQGTR